MVEGEMADDPHIDRLARAMWRATQEDGGADLEWDQLGSHFHRRYRMWAEAALAEVAALCPSCGEIHQSKVDDYVCAAQPALSGEG